MMAKQSMMVLALVGLLALASTEELVGGGQASVIQKVIDMLQMNKMKIVKDLEQEQREMTEYAEYCDDESSEKGFNIKTQSRRILDLQATIEDNAAEIRAEKDEIETLGASMAETEREIAEHEELREKERHEFEAQESELQNAIEEVEVSITVIKKQVEMVNQAMQNAVGGGEEEAESAALLQNKEKSKDGTPVGTSMKAVKILMQKLIHAAWMDNSSKEALGSSGGFLQKSGEEPAAEGGDEAGAEGGGNQSPDKMIETFEEMKTKAEETLSDVRAKEMNENHNFQMATMSLKQKLGVMKERVAEATANKDAKTESMSKAKGEMAEVEATKKADESYLQTLTQECESAATAWASRQQAAKGEMEAIDKAKDILASRVKVFVQQAHREMPDASGALVAAPSNAEERALRHKLTDHFVALGHDFRSYAMMEMANAAASDPFSKLQGMIQDMINKLVEEANAESTQKEFCDTEKAKTFKSKDKKSDRLDSLKVRLDKASTAVADLEENVKTLQTELAEDDKANSKATEIRNEERVTNEKAAKDYADGAQAVEDAIGVLQDYYSGASLLQGKGIGHPGATKKKLGLLQNKQRQPSLGSAKAGAADMILGLLENSAEEFSKMHMQLVATEAKQKKDFEKMIAESKVSKATKEAEIKGSMSEIKSLSVAIKESKEDWKMTSKELDAVLTYLQKLKPQCEVKQVTYEEKKARREAEIKGLKEAITILDGQ